MYHASFYMTLCKIVFTVEINCALLDMIVAGSVAEDY